MMIVKKVTMEHQYSTNTATAKQEETTTKINKEGANQQKHQQNNINKTPTKQSEDTSHKTQNGKRGWEVSNVKYQSKSKIESTK